ncbi:hypothetical protein FQA39_LY13819 [Lamprigera yunnana]|nr:hypothetical protein FQA39_LY13819 [Lamprigera yunnana]
MENKIQDCLAKMLKEQNINKYETVVEFSLHKGTNYLSDVGTVVIKDTKADGEEIKYDLIVKLAKTGEFRNQFSMKDLFDREIFMYKRIFPLFKKIQEENNVKKPFNVMAKFYGASKVEDQDIVVLENMSRKEFKLCDRHQTLNHRKASILFKELGRLHALSFALRDQELTLFHSLSKQLRDVEFHGEIRKVAQHFIKHLFPKSLDLIDSEKDNAAYSKLKHFPQILFDTLIQCVENEINSPYSVIVHGDLWMSNFMFKYDQMGQPTELCMLDWQFTKLSSPVIDISQAMFICLNKETRDLYLHDLINDYYNSFSNFLIELGGKPDVLFPFAVLQEHLRKFSICGLYTAVRMISLTSISSEDTPTSSIDNFAEALCNAKKNPYLFNDRMRDVLLDYVRYGYDTYPE